MLQRDLVFVDGSQVLVLVLDDGPVVDSFPYLLEKDCSGGNQFWVGVCKEGPVSRLSDSLMVCCRGFISFKGSKEFIGVNVMVNSFGLKVSND